MKTEAECIAEGIREYVAKLNELLELANIEGLTIHFAAGYNGNFDTPGLSESWSEKYRLRVENIYRKEIL